MPDFFSAAQRHLADGDFLHNHSRIPNAAQLWAYGAECSLKAIALKQGHFNVGLNGKPTAGFGLHINQTSQSGQTLLSLYNATQTGPNALPGPAVAFVGWNISARYEDGSQLQPVATYAADAGYFRQLLNLARVQGLLP